MSKQNYNEGLPTCLTDLLSFKASAGSLYMIARSFDILMDEEFNEPLLEKLGDMSAQDYFYFKASLKYCREVLKKVEQSTKYFELPENHIIL